MNIRKRIFLSYIILVLLVLVYAILIMFSGFMQKRIDKDISELYKSKEIWNDLLISMNELPINWADGKTYQKFKVKYIHLETTLKKMSEQSLKKTLFFDYSMKARKYSLYATWSIARKSIISLIDIIESNQFQRILQLVEKQTGLQRLNHLEADLVGSGNYSGRKDLYLLQQVIEKIEFFPIYSDTLNHLFNVIIKEADLITKEISQIRFIGSIIFFVLFLLLYMIFAIRFSDSISRPIINLSIKRLTTNFFNLPVRIRSPVIQTELKTLKSSLRKIQYLLFLGGRVKAKIFITILKIPMVTTFL